MISRAKTTIPRWSSLSLRAKIATFVIIASVIQLFVVGAYSYWAGQVTIDRAVRDQAHDRANEIRVALNSYFRESKLTLLAISSSPSWGKLFSEPEQRDAWLLEQQRVINYMDKTSGIGIDEFCFIGTDGREMTRLVQGEIEFDLSDDEKDNPFFEPSLEIDVEHVFHSVPYVSGDTNRWVIATTTPVLGPDGKQVAFLHFERPFTQVREVLQQALRVDGERAFILDKNNVAIASSESEVSDTDDELRAPVSKEFLAVLGVDQIDEKMDDMADQADGSTEMSMEGDEHSNTEALPSGSTQVVGHDDHDLGDAVLTYSDGGTAYYAGAIRMPFGDASDNDWLIAVSVPQTAASGFRSTYIYLPMIISVLLFLVALAAVVVGRSITRPLAALVEGADKVAAGDLDVSIQTERGPDFSRVGAAFNKMVARIKEMVAAEKAARVRLESAVDQFKGFVDQIAAGDMSSRLLEDNDDPELAALSRKLNELLDSLRNMVRDLQRAVAEIASSSQQILAATAQHNTAAAEQAASVNQTSATVDEIRQTAEQTTVRAQSVSDSANRSVGKANSGLTAVDHTITGMGKVKEQVQQISTNIMDLTEHTQNIGQIIATVNDLAEQSNLLALNASIEAARAGEQGKGFAVVAAEVRNLAEQSQQATSRVKSILDDIKDATHAVVLATDAGGKGVEEGVELANESGNVIRAIAETIQESALAAEEILGSAEQQSSGMDQMSTAMHDIHESTNQGLTSTQQIEGAVADLNDLGQRLEKQISRYKTE